MTLMRPANIYVRFLTSKLAHAFTHIHNMVYSCNVDCCQLRSEDVAIHYEAVRPYAILQF
jgi:hypothetical protein